MVSEQSIGEFKHKELLRRMCIRNPAERLGSFADVKRASQSQQFIDMEFHEREIEAYREFADCLRGIFTQIEVSSQYANDVVDIQAKLTLLYKGVMLEQQLPDCRNIARCFVLGAYSYLPKHRFPVYVVKGFLDLLRGTSREKNNIILSNIQTKLDAVTRYAATVADDLQF